MWAHMNNANVIILNRIVPSQRTENWNCSNEFFFLLVQFSLLSIYLHRILFRSRNERNCIRILATPNSWPNGCTQCRVVRTLVNRSCYLTWQSSHKCQLERQWNWNKWKKYAWKKSSLFQFHIYYRWLNEPMKNKKKNIQRRKLVIFCELQRTMCAYVKLIHFEAIAFLLLLLFSVSVVCVYVRIWIEMEYQKLH